MARSAITKLHFKNVSCGYGFEGAKAIKPVNNLTFTMSPNQIRLIQGDNGHGKSTLLKALLNEVPDINGWVEFHRTSALQNTEHSLEEFYDLIKPVFYLPQRVQGMFPQRTCVNTVIEYWSRLKNIPVESANADLSGLCDELGVAGFVDVIRWRHCEFLSGGEAQIFAMMLGHLSGYGFMLLDEPTASVSDANKPMIINLIKKYKTLSGERFILIATHDAALNSVADGAPLHLP
jgi:ABC-type multidrug transport system ATPase subunit